MFVLASRTASDGDTEGTPVAAIEAATYGVPVVATRHAGLPEVLPADAAARGYLVAEGDVQALADAIVRLASSLEERRAWGQACLSFARARTDESREAHDLATALAAAEVP